jgi:hypothetical protein
MYGPMFKLKNKPLAKSYFYEKWSKTTRKPVFHAGLFWPFCGPLTTPKWTQKMYSKACKTRCIAQCVNLKIRPPTKSLGPFFQDKGSKTTRKSFVYAVLGQFGAIRAPPHGQKKVVKGPQVGGMYGSMLKLKNKPLTRSSGPFF